MPNISQINCNVTLSLLCNVDFTSSINDNSYCPFAFAHLNLDLNQQIPLAF